MSDKKTICQLQHNSYIQSTFHRNEMCVRTLRKIFSRIKNSRHDPVRPFITRRDNDNEAISQTRASVFDFVRCIVVEKWNDHRRYDFDKEMSNIPTKNIKTRNSETNVFDKKERFSCKQGDSGSIREQKLFSFTKMFN